jgi:hypothetical protein
MFNPFSPFDPHLLTGFRQKGVQAFVRQTYDRGRNMLEAEPQPSFILIHFNKAIKAREHFDAIKTDPNRQLYIVDDPADWQALQELLNNPPGQRYYTILTIKDVNEKARIVLDKKIRYYIDHRTNWKPKGYEQISFSLDIIFGEIYGRLRYGPREVKMKLDDLENQQGYVL